MDLDIVPILEHYGFDVPDPEPGEAWTKVLCEFHGESNASASYNQYAFHCFACGVKGDAIAIIMGREEVDFAGAKQFYEGVVGEGVTEVPRAANTGRRRVSDRSRSRANRGNDRAVPARGRRRPSSRP
ncbi:hypothetical protein E1264_03730 [Actinomadura sp. KC216]|nr:hypothetical protein E1264_03730 [Actinomadura sp. KC216]